MKIRTVLAGAMLALLVAGPAGAVRTVTDPDLPRELETTGPVQVSWEDPSSFSELRGSGNRWEAEQGDWVNDLAEYLAERVGRVLPEGQRVAIHITDIDLAGDYEPGRGIDGDRIRLQRDIYPPRLRFDFTRTGADGDVIDQGERKLSDMAYLSRSNLRYHNDALAYEKRMIDDWVAREVAAAGR
ncbi:DUF3016 domain-containing protein [Lysobacter sp. SG-8]|uniref:DUF3016 domain-containing protein n=1 Tax=Marilutibacter penaei TaxID=2759900 RepID=A0A7W3YEL8_9GAMM|nr:DUF3016 domain-containing protein [Lysobacter penaei]MBB1088548.1 DUF3016 domain-containing protein [Lysobacter penaei]